MGIISSKDILGLKDLSTGKELESIYNSSPAYAFLWSPEENWPVEFVSENIRLLGYAPEDFTSGHLLYGDIVHPDDLGRLTSAILEYQEKEDAPFFNLEYRILDSSGKVHWVGERSLIKRDSKGKIKHLHGLILDITERKKAEMAVSEANKYLESIINTISEPLVILDKDLRVVSASRSFYNFFKTTPKNTEGRFFYKLGKGQQNIPELKSLLENVILKKSSFDEFEIERDFMNIGKRTMLLNGRNMQKGPDDEPMALVAIEDITQRKKAEIELRTSEEKYSTLVEKGNDGILIVQDGTIRFANSKLFELSGYSDQELLGAKLLDHLPVEYRRMVAKKYKKALKDSRSVQRNYEIEFLKKEGSVFPAEISFSYIHHEDSPAVMITIRDITQRKKAETELRASEEKYSTLVEKSEDGILIVQDEVVKFVNSKLAELTGTTKQKILGTPFVENLPVEYRRMAFNKYKKVLKDSRSLLNQYEIELSSRNGGTFPAEISFSYIHHEGNPAVMITIRDITQRKRAEIELKASEKRYSTLVEKGNDGIVIVQDDVLVFANLKFGEITGYTKDKAIGKPFGDFLSMEYRHMIVKKFKKNLEKGRNVHRKYEAELLSKNGKRIPVEINTSIIENEGRPAYMAIIRDITQQKEKEQELLDLIEVQKVLENVIKTSPAVVFFWRAEDDWPVEFVSENISQFGYDAEDFTSGKILYGDIIHPSDLEKVREEVYRCYQGGEDLSHEYRILTNSGEVRWVDERSVVKRDDEGNVEYMQGIIVDITDRKNVNNFMHVESELGNFFSPTGDLKDIFNQLLEFTVQLDRIDSGVLYLVDEFTGELNLVAHSGLSSSFVKSIRHYEPKSINARLFMTGYPIYKLYHEINALTPGKDLSYEGLEATAIIPVKYREDFVAVLFLASHTEYSIPPNVRDSLETIASQVGAVLGRIRDEVDFQKNQNNLQSLFDSLEDFIFVIDIDGCILHTNHFARKRLGYLSDELIGMNILKLHPPNKALEAASVIGDIIAGRSSSSTIPLASQNGEVVPVETKFTRGEWEGQEVFVGLSRETSPNGSFKNS